MAATYLHLAEPLLQVDANDKASDKKPSVLKVPQTKAQLVKLLLNNLPLLIMVVITMCSMAGLFGFEAEHLFLHMSLITFVASLALAGSVQGTYLVYTSVQLQEQIEEFRAENAKMKEQNTEYAQQNEEQAKQNEKLKKQVAALQGIVKQMEEVSDELKKDLNGFSNLRDSMEKYSAEMGADFKETMKRANELYTSMETMTKENERTLLYKCAQDLEFMDREAGFSKVEFDRFCKRIPKAHQQQFQNTKFEDLANQDGVIEYEQIQEMIEKLIKVVKFTKNN